MPVRIKSKTRVQGSVTPTALNTETEILDLADQSDDFILEGFISLRELASGDVVILRMYIAVDGATRELADEIMVSGPVTPSILRIPAMTLAYNSKPRVTVTQTSGTLRTVRFVFIYQVMEVI
jgi:hypothetical protein